MRSLLRLTLNVAIPVLVSCGQNAKAQTVHLVAVGDVMMARGVEAECHKHGWDYPFGNLSPILLSADIAFGNLECPVSLRGTRMSRIINLRADPACLPALKRAGFTMLSVANNHAMDFGLTAFSDTLAGLRRQSIIPVGGGDTYSEATAGTIVEKRGLRIGFLGFCAFPDSAGATTPDQPSIGAMSDERLIRSVRSLRVKCDVVVVSCHWGVEGRTTHIPMQERLAHALIDAGAALVLGHHPHVPQEIARYKGGVIVYSMGNCVFDSRNRGGRDGILVRCVLTKKGVGSFSSAAVTISKCRPSVSFPDKQGFSPLRGY